MACPLQQLLHKRSSTLRLYVPYFPCLVEYVCVCVLLKDSISKVSITTVTRYRMVNDEVFYVDTLSVVTSIQFRCQMCHWMKLRRTGGMTTIRENRKSRSITSPSAMSSETNITRSCLDRNKVSVVTHRPSPRYSLHYSTITLPCRELIECI